MTQTLKEAKKRIPSQRDKIIKLLKESGEQGATNKELQNICIRWDARVRELYQLGYVIEVNPIGNGVYNYKLVSEPETTVEKPKKAIEILIHKINKKYDGEINSDDLNNLLESEGLQVVRKYGSHKKSK
ncbi:hypothetical protein [Metabacillus fastidiosus]|uniref:hypothetical protein n=1 Tax=Metabacillus fastidiosus TaxID=1458 RepID=UPI003D29FF34